MLDRYENPLCKRYASREMHIYSQMTIVFYLAYLWVSACPKARKSFGLPIRKSKVEDKAPLYDIHYEVAAKREAEVRHMLCAYLRFCDNAAGKAHIIWGQLSVVGTHRYNTYAFGALL